MEEDTISSMKQVGTIALDIDGTITDKNHLIPSEVADFFLTLFSKGWQFIFITGRPFSFAFAALSKLSFPYLLGVQNGADLLKMPEKKHIQSFYLNTEILKTLETIYKDKEEDFLIYSGFEKGDFCYYRPAHFSSRVTAYLERLQTLAVEPWMPLDNFNDSECESFPLIKCFGKKSEMEEIAKKLQPFQNIQVSVIKDPVSPEFFLLLITNKKANKGDGALNLLKIGHLPRPLIVGGDDNNDIPLLKVGDIKIAMEGAPDALISLADIIAKPSHQFGIIAALKKAIGGSI